MQFTGSQFELKQLDDTGSIEGLLAGFGDVDLGGDVLQAGCLTRSLSARSTPLPILLCHDHQRPIGAWRSWQERDSGLYAKGKLTLACHDGREAYELVKDGGLRGISIGWLPKRSAPGDGGVRLVAEAEVLEASLVPVPMHPRATVTAIKGFSGPGDIADLLQAKGVAGRPAREAAGVLWAAITEQSEQAAVEADLAAIAQAKRADEAKLVAIIEASIDRLNAMGGR